MTTPIERFMALVVPEPNTGCWLFVGCWVNGGYGLFRVGERRVVAHQFSYEHFVGPVPDDLELDHLCRTRCCVRPDHLEPVTQAENRRRGLLGSDETNPFRLRQSCPKGHPYNDANTLWWNGRRSCRECNRASSRLYQRRRQHLTRTPGVESLVTVFLGQTQ